MVEIEQSSANVYADLGAEQADDMLLKAELARQIGHIIKNRRLTQQQAADVLGIAQPKLSQLLRGQFRGVSEAKMLNGLSRLGQDVQILIAPTQLRQPVGQIRVLAAA